MLSLMVAFDAPHFYAGAIFEEREGKFICVKAAPIIKYMIGKTSIYCLQYARSKGWKAQQIP